LKGEFTGRHAFAIIGGGFALVIAVNIALAAFALRTNPGLVVENSYVASQKFNGWLARGRAQKAMGWSVVPAADAATLTVTAADSLGRPLTGLHAVATLEHPLGAEPPRSVSLAEVAPGRYAVRHGLAPGQWLAEVRLVRGSQNYYLSTRLIVPAG
jgi:nitrogen fixation protein FixH